MYLSLSPSRIGEGGFAYVYHVRQGDRVLALKRLMAHDEEKKQQSVKVNRGGGGLLVDVLGLKDYTGPFKNFQGSNSKIVAY